MNSFRAVGCSCCPHCVIVKTNLIVFGIWWWFCRFFKLLPDCSDSIISTLQGADVTLIDGLCWKALCCLLLTDVIHTVGPVARGHVGPTESNDLTSCYQNSLRLMKENDLSTVVSTVHYQHSSEEKLVPVLCSLKEANYGLLCFCLTVNKPSARKAVFENVLEIWKRYKNKRI